MNIWTKRHFSLINRFHFEWTLFKLISDCVVIISGFISDDDIVFISVSLCWKPSNAQSKENKQKMTTNNRKKKKKKNKIKKIFFNIYSTQRNLILEPEDQLVSLWKSFNQLWAQDPRMASHRSHPFNVKLCNANSVVTLSVMILTTWHQLRTECGALYDAGSLSR